MIDFTKLNSLYRTITNERPDTDKSLNIIQRERQQARDSFRKLNDNIKAAESLKIKILKGAKCGESPEQLLLDAAQCISLLTGDDSFREQVAVDMTIHHRLKNGEMTYITMETQHRLHLMKRCIEQVLQQYKAQ